MSGPPTSLRLKPNLFASGALVSVKAEVIPPELVGQACTLRLLEVDEEGKAPGVRLAEFTVQLAEEGETYRFQSAERVVAAGEETEAPSEEPGEYGEVWKLPYLRLAFDGCEGEHAIRIDSANVPDRFRREGGMFELGLELHDAAGAEVFPLDQPLAYARLNCGEVIAHNCSQAAVYFVSRQRSEIKKRGYGTWYGSQSSYRAHMRGESWAETPAHPGCHTCALRVDDEGARRKPLPGSAKADHQAGKAKTKLLQTDCTVYIHDTIELALEKAHLRADKAHFHRRRWGSGLEVGRLLRDLGFVTILFASEGPFEVSGKNPVKEAAAKGAVSDIMSGNADQRWAGTYPHSCPIDLVIEGHGSAEHANHADARAQFERLSELPFVVFLPGSQVHMLIGVKGALHECHWGGGPRDPLLFDDTDTVESHFGWSDVYAFVPLAYWRRQVEIAKLELRPLETIELELPEIELRLPEPAGAGATPDSSRGVEVDQFRRGRGGR